MPVTLGRNGTSDPSQPYYGGGIGFVLTARDPFCGIDLDHCVELITGGVAPWAHAAPAVPRQLRRNQPQRSRCPYPHTWQSRPGSRATSAALSRLYDRHRYVTMTGWHIAGSSRTIQARQAELIALHHHVFPPSTPATAPPVTLSTQTDDAVFETASRRYGSRFLALWAGTALPGRPVAHSEADFELAAARERVPQIAPRSTGSFGNPGSCVTSG